MLKKSRLNAVLGRMEKMGLEQMVVTDAISILYLTEVWVDACERLVALYINKNGENRFFVNDMFHVPENVGVQVVRFTDTDPYLKMLADCTDHTKPLGVDKNIPARFLLPLMEIGAGTSYVNAPSVWMRRELLRMRRSVRPCAWLPPSTTRRWRGLRPC